MRASNDGRQAVRPGRGLAVALTGVLAVAAVLAGCSSSSTSTTSTTAAPTTTTKASGLSPTAVKALQAALVAVGCYAGTVDGVVGPATTKAVRAFQAADGLTADGVYGSATRTKLLAAAAAGTRVCTTPSTTTTTSASPTTTSASGQAAALVATINAWMAANGPTAGTWALTSTALSTVDPTYALFRIGPAPGYENSVQGGYGFAHLSGGTWSVIGFGSAGVGCPPGTATYPAVPAAVLAGFGVTCPAG